MTDQDRYIDKIQKLLRKAESTTAEEAELLIAKAQELMTQYAIDEAMIEAAGGDPDEIVQEDITFTGIFQGVLLNLSHVVAIRNQCRSVYTKYTRQRPHRHVHHVIGFRRDVERVKLLVTSLEVQAASAMQEWWASTDRSWYSRSTAYKERRAFLQGYADTVGRRLTEANRRAHQEAEQRYAAAAAGQDEAQPDQVTTSVALVLADRKKRVDAWVDERYGKLRSGRSRGYDMGTGSGYAGGRAAGERADLGSPRVGNRKEIGR